MSDINNTISKLKESKQNLEGERTNLKMKKDELDKKFINNTSSGIMTTNRIKKYPNNTLLFNKNMIELDYKIKNLEEHIIKLENIQKQQKKQTQGGKRRKSRRKSRRTKRKTSKNLFKFFR